jgi:hypothetical protein
MNKKPAAHANSRHHEQGRIGEGQVQPANLDGHDFADLELTNRIVGHLMPLSRCPVLPDVFACLRPRARPAGYALSPSDWATAPVSATRSARRHKSQAAETQSIPTAMCPQKPIEQIAQQHSNDHAGDEFARQFDRKRVPLRSLPAGPIFRRHLAAGREVRCPGAF